MAGTVAGLGASWGLRPLPGVGVGYGVDDDWPLWACYQHHSTRCWLGGMRRSYATALMCSISALDSRTVHC
jgi:hypothetical protein